MESLGLSMDGLQHFHVKLSPEQIHEAEAFQQPLTKEADLMAYQGGTPGVRLGRGG